MVRFLAIAAACATFGVVGRAHADDAQALFDRGLADMQAERYATGCPALAESFRLDPQPGALFTLATCEARWGRLATAVRRYDEYLALFAAMSPTAQADQKGRERIAAEHKAALGRLVPQVTIVLSPSAPSGSKVFVRGSALEPSKLGVPLSIDPGELVVVVEGPGGRREHRFTVSPGDRRRIEVGASTPPPAKPRPAPAVTESPSYRSWAIVALSVGIAGLATGTILGLRARSEKATVDERCDDDHLCDQEGLDALDRGRTAATASTIAFAVGAVGVGAGVTLLWLGPGDRPSGVAVSGRWSW